MSQSTNTAQDLEDVADTLKHLTAVQLSYVDPYLPAGSDDEDEHISISDLPSAAAATAWPFLPLKELSIYTTTEGMAMMTTKSE